MDGWMDGGREGWLHGWMDGWMDAWMTFLWAPYTFISVKPWFYGRMQIRSDVPDSRAYGI